MKDPHIHVEKHTAGFTHAVMREMITQATGLAPDAPETVLTGCRKKRLYVMTSAIPEKVTCLACREFAHTEHLQAARSAELLIEAAEAVLADTTGLIQDLRDWGHQTLAQRPLLETVMHEHQKLAARYAQ